jgi:hypothetical protein
MKLYIGDHLGGHKTTKEIEKWFGQKGHEVQWDMYYEPKKAEWADVIFFEWCEGMMNLCLRAGWGKKKPVYARAMDIEIWAGQAAREDLTDLHGLAYTSKAYFEVLKDDAEWHKKYPNLPTHHIPLSIDVNNWTYKEREKGRNVAVLGHMWDAKGPQMIPQFVKYLIDKTGDTSWKFYVQGHWRHDVWKWYLYYFKHIIKELGIEENIVLNEKPVESIDEWLEDKNYLVTFSMKDAFSIPVAEAQAKGIKALPHNFLGAKDIWDKYVWSTFDELYTMMIDDEYNSQEYHDNVKSKYSNEVIMPLWEELFIKNI